MDNSKEGLDNSKWISTSIISIGVFIVFLDISIVNIVLPKMISSLDTDIYGIQWVVISYLISGAIGMNTVAWMGAAIGHKNTFIVGLLLFTVSSALCGQARNIEMMVFFRFLQGLGEGIVAPIGMTILFRLFPPEEKGMAMGIFASACCLAPAMGPTIGGILTEHFNWRWVFYVNVPIGVMGIALSLFFLRETKSEEEKPWPFDILGFALIVVCFMSLITFLSKGQEKGWLQSDYIVILIAVFVVSFILMIIVELNMENPLVDLRIFRFNTCSLSFIACLIYCWNFYGTIFIMPLYLQQIKLYPTLTAGVTLLPGALIEGCSMVMAGLLADRYGCKKPLLFGLIGSAVGSYLLFSFDFYTPQAKIIGYYSIYCFLTGFVPPVVSITILLELSEAQTNQGSIALNVSRLAGGAIGTALIATVLGRRTDTYFEALGTRINSGNVGAMNVLGKMTLFLQSRGIPGVLAKQRALMLLNYHTLAKGLSYAFQSAFIWMGIWALMAAAVAIFIREKR